MLYAPGNDPFVITVGALDLGGTLGRNDDFAAPWSAYGLHARRLHEARDRRRPAATWSARCPATRRSPPSGADKLVAPGYIQLSGTSFAAPVVAGAAAQILAKHPTYTPDQVKGALMVSATPLPAATPGLGRRRRGAGEQGLARPDQSARTRTWGWTRSSSRSRATATPAFDAVSWVDAAKANVSWDDVSWDDVSWNDAAWSVVSWADVSWADVSWADVSWADVSWADVSWSDMSDEDAAEGDASASRAATS